MSSTPLAETEEDVFDLTDAVPETERLDSSLQKAKAQLSIKTRRHRPSRSRLRDSLSSTEGDDSFDGKSYSGLLSGSCSPLHVSLRCPSPFSDPHPSSCPAKKDRAFSFEATEKEQKRRSACFLTPSSPTHMLKQDLQEDHVHMHVYRDHVQQHGEDSPHLELHHKENSLLHPRDNPQLNQEDQPHLRQRDHAHLGRVDRNRAHQEDHQSDQTHLHQRDHAHLGRVDHKHAHREDHQSDQTHLHQRDHAHLGRVDLKQAHQVDHQSDHANLHKCDQLQEGHTNLHKRDQLQKNQTHVGEEDQVQLPQESPSPLRRREYAQSEDDGHDIGSDEPSSPTVLLDKKTRRRFIDLGVTLRRTYVKVRRERASRHAAENREPDGAQSRSSRSSGPPFVPFSWLTDRIRGSGSPKNSGQSPAKCLSEEDEELKNDSRSTRNESSQPYQSLSDHSDEGRDVCAEGRVVKKKTILPFSSGGRDKTEKQNGVQKDKRDSGHDGDDQKLLTSQSQCKNLDL